MLRATCHVFSCLYIRYYGITYVYGLQHVSLNVFFEICQSGTCIVCGDMKGLLSGPVRVDDIVIGLSVVCR